MSHTTVILLWLIGSMFVLCLQLTNKGSFLNHFHHKRNNSMARCTVHSWAKKWPNPKRAKYLAVFLMVLTIWIQNAWSEN